MPKLLFIWLLIWLLICGPALALEIRPKETPDYLIAQTSDYGFSTDDQRLTWWDMKTKQRLKALAEPVCLEPFPPPAAKPTSPDVVYQQSGDELLSWCEYEGLLSRWHIPSGRLLERNALEGLRPFTLGHSPRHSIGSRWVTQDGYALMEQRKELIRLFDKAGHVLKELELGRQLSGLWMNERYLAGATGLGIQIWRVPHLEPASHFSLSRHERVIGLTKQRLVTRLDQPTCDVHQQSLPLGAGLDCQNKGESRVVALRYWDLETGRLVSQQVLGAVRDIGLSPDYAWALFANQLNLFDEQGRVLKSLSLAGMRGALIKDRYGIAWSEVLLCSLDLQRLSRPACRPLNRAPDEVVLTDRFVYAYRGDDYDWGRWQAYRMPELEALGSPQNLTGSHIKPEALGNPASTPMFRTEPYWGRRQKDSFLELDGIKARSSFSPFSSRFDQAARYGDLLAATGAEERLVVYHLPSGRVMGTWPAQDPPPDWVTMSEERLVALYDDPMQPMIRIYELPGLRFMAELDGHNKPIEKALMTGDSLVTANHQELRLWDLREPRLKDSLAFRNCDPQLIAYQAPRLLYQCVGEQIDDNGRDQSTRNQGHHQIHLLTLAQDRLSLLDSYRSRELVLLTHWKGDELTLSREQRLSLQNDRFHLLEAKPETRTWQNLLGTWPDIVIQEVSEIDSNLQLFDSLEDQAKVRILPDSLSVEGRPDERLLVTSDRLIKLTPRAEGAAPMGASQHLRTGDTETYELQGTEFPLNARSDNFGEPMFYREGEWELEVRAGSVIARNAVLKLENRFLYPGPFPQNSPYPTVWPDADGEFLIYWEVGWMLQRCRFQGDCYDADMMPTLRTLRKIGNRLLGEVLPTEKSEAGPEQGRLWLWDADSLEVLRVIDTKAFTRVLEISPPGTVTLYQETSGFSRHQILRLADGEILATYYSLLRPQGMLIVTEDGYYAGTGNYRELVEIDDGARRLNLKDFPEFHRPDLVWQMLQGNTITGMPVMPGLSWAEQP